MESVYAAMLLHKAGKPITEDNVTHVLEAAGVNAEPAKVKALVASLSEINIDEAIKTAVVTGPAPVAPAVAAPAEKEKPKKEEEPEKKEEAALEGLGALFG